MDDLNLDFSTADAAATSARFPAARHPLPSGHPTGDVSYLGTDSSDFAQHAWDEGGH